MGFPGFSAWETANSLDLPSGDGVGVVIHSSKFKLTVRHLKSEAERTTVGRIDGEFRERGAEPGDQLWRGGGDQHAESELSARDILAKSMGAVDSSKAKGAKSASERKKAAVGRRYAHPQIYPMVSANAL